MGCDIHLHTEIKLNGEWYGYGAPNILRSYKLFGKMAGVRSDEVEPISMPKGLPDDCSKVVKFASDKMGIDGHSHSYLTADEILELEDWYAREFNDIFPERQWGYFFGNSWGGFSKYPQDNPEGVEDVRFTFWFDN